jgi:type II secretory pathway pseudopilin PulG
VRIASISSDGALRFARRRAGIAAFTSPDPRKHQAFSLVETVFAVALLALAVSALFSGIVSGFSTIQAQRENLRATEIMTEKLDTIRLYSWTQLTNGFITNYFTVSFYPTNQVLTGAGASNPGITYAGTISIVNLDISESYSNTLKQVTVSLNWNSGSRPRTEQMSTIVSQYGIQGYVY